MEILEARKEYCHEVLTQVLDPDNRRGRNNPVGALREIMISLNAIIEATEDLIQLTTFHEHGARLDDAILGMATQTFQVFQLTCRYTFLYHCYSGKTSSLESNRSHSPATAKVADEENSYCWSMQQRT